MSNCINGESLAGAGGGALGANRCCPLPLGRELWDNRRGTGSETLGLSLLCMSFLGRSWCGLSITELSRKSVNLSQYPEEWTLDSPASTGHCGPSPDVVMR